MKKTFQSLGTGIIVGAVLFISGSVLAATSIGTSVSTGGSIASTGDISLSGGDLNLGSTDLLATSTLTRIATGLGLTDDLDLYGSELRIGSGAATSTLAKISNGLGLSTDLDIYGGDIRLGSGAATTTITSSAGNLGFGTTTPFATVAIAAGSLSSTHVFAISTSTASATSTAFIVNSDGRVGINSGVPTAPLDVVGIASTTKLIVGGFPDTGTVESLLFGTCTFNPGEVTASSTKSTDCTGATGVTTTHRVFVTPVNLENGLVFVSASSTSAAVIQVSVQNTGWINGSTHGVSVTPTSRSWYWMAIK